MDKHSELNELHFNCPEGQFNAVAYLLFNGPEEAIKLFYSPARLLSLRASDMIAVLLVYVCLNVGMMGLAVPMGSFIPNMFIGAVSGRLIGHLLNHLELPFGFAKPSVYALMGSAAMLGGSLRQTLSIVVFLTECINDMSLIPVLMVSVFVSNKVAKMVGERGLDEELIVRKGVRYLDAELPKELDTVQITAADLCLPLPASALLAPVSTVAAVRLALKECDSGTFPVLSAGRCLGLVTRKRLQTVVNAQFPAEKVASEELQMERRCTNGAGADEDDDLQVSEFIADLCRSGSTVATTSEDCGAKLALHRIMDKAPMTLLETMPVPRFHSLFTRTDINAVCVVSIHGDFVGLLTRSSLIDAVLRCEGHSSGDHAPAATTAPGGITDVEAGGTGHGLGSEPAVCIPSSRPAEWTAHEDCNITQLKARIAELEAALAAASVPQIAKRDEGVADSPSSSPAGAGPT